MKPYVICHMMSSIDGHALTNAYDRPFKKDAGELYEKLAATFEFDGWICGRTTMEEVAHGKEFRKAWRRSRSHGRRISRSVTQPPTPLPMMGMARLRGRAMWRLALMWLRCCRKRCRTDYLAYLRSIDVSYFFGGKTEIDLAQVVQPLADELGTQCLIVEDGPHVSGPLVNAGLVEEIGVLILPLIDGRGHHPASFEIAEERWTQPSYLTRGSAEVHDGGGMWLRYKRT